jgi:hypothetical protein
MSRAAPRAAVPPLRLSYRHALLAVRGFWHTAWLSPPGVLPRRLEALLEERRFIEGGGGCRRAAGPTPPRSSALQPAFR